MKTTVIFYNYTTTSPNYTEVKKCCQFCQMLCNLKAGVLIFKCFQIW